MVHLKQGCGRAAALACLLTLVGASIPAQAGEPRVTKARASHPHFGAMLDVGAPDLLGLSVIFRPVRWARLHGGATTNLISGGIRGGVTLVPFDFGIRPSLTFEGGRMFEGDANWLGKMFGVQSAVLENVGYTYINLHGGLEFGSARGFTFFIHGGLSYITTKIHNLQSEIDDPSITFSDPTLEYLGPSGKIGFVVFI